LSYYIRVLGTNSSTIPLHRLREISKPALLEGNEDEDGWNKLLLSHASGAEIAIIEKNSAIEGELGAEEIQEFMEEVAAYKPDSAAAWLRSYLPGVKVIYAFQLLSGTDIDDGWSLLHNVYGEIKNQACGISQADGEGFSNEDGHSILWQFSDTVTGAWNCAVLTENREWKSFEMDLENLEHREAFWRSEVPQGAKLIEP